MRDYIAAHGADNAPLLVLAAFMDDTRLCLRDLGGTWHIVRLQPGDVLIFRGDILHFGLGYTVWHYRVHAHIRPANYTGPMGLVYFP